MTKKLPAITIIVPIYNVEAFLSECLDSIANQSQNNFSVLLINDGSTDNSVAIAEQYVEKSPALFTLLHKENGGLSDARNFGINHTKSDYVMFVDSDDLIASDTIEKVSNALLAEPSDILCFGMTEITESGQHIRNIPPTTGNIIATNLQRAPELLTQALPNACNKVIKTSIFTQHRITFPQGLWYEDLATTPKLFSCANTISFIEDNLYHYRTREGSITQTISPKILDMLTVLGNINNYFLKQKASHMSPELRDKLTALSINMLMKTLVRITACKDQDLQHNMLKEVQAFMHSTMPPSFKLLQSNSKNVYKFTLFLTAIKMNKLVLSFLTFCLKKGLVRA
ncbi:glycosyltransferase family 2 protein [Colwellia sp. MEBiC06753]